MKPTGKWRTITEESIMINNDEYVYYSDRELKEDLPDNASPEEYRAYRSANPEHIVFSRPVFDIEVQDGLNVLCKDGISVFDEKIPESTSAIDGMFKLMKHVDLFLNVLHQKPVDAVEEYVASRFYDCMSGGCDVYSLAMCRYLIEKYKFDLNTPVYPSKNGSVVVDGNPWASFADFLKEVENIPRYEQKFLGIVETLCLPEGR